MTPMKQFLPLLMLSCLLFGQDVLTTKSGETYRGRYLGELDDDKIMFKDKRKDYPTPILRSDILELKLNNDLSAGFATTLKLKSGDEIIGKWEMTSLDSVQFIQYSDNKTLNINIDEIQYIKKPNGDGIDLNYVTNPLQQDEWQKRELKRQCEKNKTRRIIVMPIKDDFYGLTEIIQDNYDSLCFNIIDNTLGLEYMHEEDIDLDDINDFHLKKIGKELGAYLVIYGYTYDFEVPFKYSATTSDAIGIGELWRANDDTWGTMFNLLGKSLVMQGQVNQRDKAITQAGSYVNLTYFALNLDTGEKVFILKNWTVLKVG